MMTTHEARQRLEQALHSLRGGDRSPEAIRGWLEAAGVLLAAGESVDEALDPSELATELTRGVGAIDGQALERNAIDLIETLDAIDEHESDSTDAIVVVERALATRHAAELALLAAERFGRYDVPLPLATELGSLIVSFDELVRPELPRLTAFNELRADHARAIAPALSDRFWWYTAGVSVHPDAYAHVAHVADLIACFPAEGARLAEIRGAATLIRGGAPPHRSRRDEVAVTREDERATIRGGNDR